MALNPYTLYNLYDKGILECVPTDLLAPTPIGAMTSMSNPYLNMAQQGGLYQNYGVQTDSFQLTGVQSPYVQNYQTYGNLGDSVKTGSMSPAGGINTFNGVGIGSQSPAGGVNTFGGFEDTKNGLINGYNKTVSIINNTPKVILGILGGAIGVGALMIAFRRGKKPASTAKQSFWSHFNPKNWNWLNKK